MKIGAIVLCRYDSSRLPGKILTKIDERPLLQLILERVGSVFASDRICVATTVEATDDPIAEYCRQNGVNCFRGHKEDVAQRFLDCANAYEYDFAIRINGDNLFTDPAVLRSMVQIAESNEYDFVTNVVGRTFPTGMSVEIVRRTFYSQSISLFDQAEHREHVTLYFYQNPSIGKRFIFENQVCPEAVGMHLAIDTPDDLRVAQAIFGCMDDNHLQYDMCDIVKLRREVQDAS